MSERVAFAGKVEAEGRRIRGEVVLAGSRTWRGGEWWEIDPAALVKADATGLFASWEHDDGQILGSTLNGTLTVNRTERGFTYETAEVPNTSYANDALVLLDGKYVQGTSFEIEGIRSSFSTDPETGDRVRRITSIKRLRQVGPVRDPAFANSSAAAFSKENEDMTEVAKEPTAAPAPEATPEPTKSEPAKFTAPPAQDDVFAATEQFARTLDAPRIVNAMDALMASANGNLRGDDLRQYEAYAKVYNEFTKGDADETARAERMKRMHDLRLGRAPKAPASDVALYQSDDYKHGFNQYLRTGNERFMEQFAQSVAGDGTQGGYTVPDTLYNRVTQSLKYYGGVADVADEIVTSTGETIHWPSINDTANTAAIAAEGTQVAAGGADVVFGEVSLGAFEYDATGANNDPVAVSLVLLQDSAIDIEGRLATLLSQRIGRKQAVDFAGGAGTTEPVGLFTKSPDSMTATAVSLALPEHVLQVDQAYRDQGNCGWLLSDATLLKIWQTQTTTNVPLITNGTIAGAPAPVLWGYPYKIDAAAGTKVAFGDFKAGYIVRRVRSIELLVDPYTLRKSRQVAYHAWARADGNIQDALAYSVSDWATVSADT